MESETPYIMNCITGNLDVPVPLCVVSGVMYLYSSSDLEVELTAEVRVKGSSLLSILSTVTAGIGNRKSGKLLVPTQIHINNTLLPPNTHTHFTDCGPQVVD